MNDQEKSREQLIEEDADLRRRLAAVDAQLARSQQAEADQRQITSSLPVLIAAAGLDGYYKEVNAAFERILGWSEQESLSRPFMEFIHPEDRAAAVETLGRLRTGEPAINFLDRNVCKDGSHRWINWNVIPVPDREIVFGIGQDLTEKKRAEDELRRSEAKWRSVVGNAPVFVAIVDHADTIQFLNRAAPGMVVQDAIGKSVYDFIQPEFRETARPCIERVRCTGETAVYETLAAGPNGDLSWYETHVGPVKIDDELVGVTLVSTHITDRKQAERKLRESEERFRKVFEEGPLGVALLGLDLHLQHVNKRLCDMLGYSENEIIQLGIPAISHPDDVDRDRQLVDRLLRGEIPHYTMHKRYVRKDGQVIWGQLTASLLHDHEGRPTHGIGMIEDITERKRAEEAIRQSEQRMRLHVEQTPLAVIEWDLKLSVSKWNPGAERIFGYTSHEALGRHFTFLVPPRVQERVDQVWDGLRAKKGGERSTNENVTKDGRTILCDWYNTPLVNAEGQVVGFASLAEDITDRKRMEAALRASEAKYRRLHQSMRDAFVSVSMDGQIQESNDAYRQMLGYDREELLALRYTDITPVKWHSFEAQIVQEQIMPSGHSGIYEKEYRRKDGTVFPVELRTFLITDDDGKPAVMWAIVRDITERKRVETALRQAHDELEQRVEERTTELREANELLRAEVEQRRQAEAKLKAEQQALCRMVLASDQERHLITYDLHDGVAQQLLGAKMLFESQQPSSGRKTKALDAYQEGMEALRRASSELRRMMNWLRTPVLDRFGLVEAIADVATQLRATPDAPEIEYHHAVQCKRLERTLENTLFRIAQEAMTNACRHSQSAKVRVKLTQKGDDVTLEVRDWGIGFDPDTVQENRFGLEGIRERCRVLGGKLSIKSQPGRGTVVQVKVPVLEATEE